MSKKEKHGQRTMVRNIKLTSNILIVNPYKHSISNNKEDAATAFEKTRKKITKKLHNNINNQSKESGDKALSENIVKNALKDPIKQLIDKNRNNIFQNMKFRLQQNTYSFTDRSKDVSPKIRNNKSQKSSLKPKRKSKLSPSVKPKKNKSPRELNLNGTIKVFNHKTNPESDFSKKSNRMFGFSSLEQHVNQQNLNNKPKNSLNLKIDFESMNKLNEKEFPKKNETNIKNKYGSKGYSTKLNVLISKFQNILDVNEIKKNEFLNKTFSYNQKSNTPEIKSRRLKLLTPLDLNLDLAEQKKLQAKYNHYKKPFDYNKLIYNNNLSQTEKCKNEKSVDNYKKEDQVRLSANFANNENVNATRRQISFSSYTFENTSQKSNQKSNNINVDTPLKNLKNSDEIYTEEEHFQIINSSKKYDEINKSLSDGKNDSIKSDRNSKEAERLPCFNNIYNGQKGFEESINLRAE